MDGIMKDKLARFNIPCIILKSDWKILNDNILKLSELIKKYGVKWLIVDSYYATADYLKKLDEFVRVLYIDDLAKETYEVSAILRYIQWNNAEYKEKYITIRSFLYSLKRRVFTY